MINIFFEKSYTKCDGEAILRSYSKKIKIEYISGSIVSNFIQFVLIVYQVEDYCNILKLSCRPLAFILYKTFVKNKKRSGTSFPASFSSWVLRKNVSLVIFYFLNKFHWMVAFTLGDIRQYVYCNCLLTRFDAIHFEINLIFLIKSFFQYDQKSKTKTSKQ